MTIGTGGTSTTHQSGTGSVTVLTSILQPGSFVTPAGTVFSVTETDADIATFNQGIKDDQNPNLPAPGAGPMWGWSRNGVLYVPNRGALRCLPGDLLMLDTTTGWPILISGRSAAAGPWTFTAT